MKIFFIMMLISTSTFAKEFSECLDGAVEMAIATKARTLSGSENGYNCSNLGMSEFQHLSEQREAKLRFKNSAVKEMKLKKKIELSFLSDLDENTPGEGDEAQACSYINIKTNVWVRNMYADKYPTLKDCPAAVDAFKKSLSKSSMSSAPLFELCGNVEKAEGELKAALGSCKTEAPPVVEHHQESFRPAVFSSSGISSRAARATEQ